MIAPNKSEHPKKRAFLAAYSQCGVVAKACRVAGVGRTQHYQWLKDDDEYASQFQSAHLEACELLEVEARRRATEGVRKYKFFKGLPIMQTCESSDPECVVKDDDGKGLKPYYELEYSDTLLIFMLKGAMPEKYGDKINATVKDETADEVGARKDRLSWAFLDQRLPDAN